MGVPQDPSAQTEDLGDDAMKASGYGIENLKRIMPNLIEWTKADGEDYDDLEELYGQLIGQWNRYMGHVAANVGGVYEYNKTYDQAGAVYVHAPKDKQRRAVQFLIDQAFETPEWMVNREVLARIEAAGIVNRIRSGQERALGNLLDFSRLARMIENETMNGREAYSVKELMDDLRAGIWTEAEAGRAVDTYRRNLQRAYVEGVEALFTEEQRPMPAGWGSFFAYTPIDVSQSDIRPLARMELKQLRGLLSRAVPRTADAMTKAHYEDLMARIDDILDQD
jgi:hypothetical protein